MDNNTNALLDFQDPGALNEELTHVPGFIDELTNYTLSQAHNPNRTLAFMGATAMLAHLTGRAYADTHGTQTNLYLIALGETGIGKDAPRRINCQLADAIGATETLCDQTASGEALETLIAEHAVILFQPDEIETLIGAMSSNGKNAACLSERVRRLYSASAGKYAVRATAKHPKGAVVTHPHFTIFGTGTPDAFYNALNAKSIGNGLFGRCLVLNVPDAYEVNQPICAPVPDELVGKAKYLAAKDRVIQSTDSLTPQIVGETDDARTLLAGSADKLMEIRRELTEKGLFTARALAVRMSEKIAKLALIYAISADAENPVITAEGVSWAVKLIGHITKAMLHEAQFHVAEGKFDSLVKRFLGLLAKHGGTLDRRYLLRSLHIDDVTFKRIVRTLHMCDEIIEESECGKNTTYTLKSAD